MVERNSIEIVLYQAVICLSKSLNELVMSSPQNSVYVLTHCCCCCWQRYPSSAEAVVAGLRLPGSVIRSDERGVVVAFPSQHPAGTYRVRLQVSRRRRLSDLELLRHRPLYLST